MDLNAVWYVLLGFLLTGYAVLDGFDLGVGILHLFAPRDEDRRVSLNAIGPVWDGNEVWLVTGGGALFAAFPKVYATVFSGFYVTFMLLLVALIVRAVSIEFRSKQPMAWWRNFWDLGFGLGSLAAAFLFGVTFGNLAAGIPLDAEGEFLGGLAAILRPYPLLVGVATVALFMMHGSAYLAMKTEGPFQDGVRRRAKLAAGSFWGCYMITTCVSFFSAPHLIVDGRIRPVILGLCLLNLAVIFNVWIQLRRGRDGRAFFSSCAAIVFLMAAFGIGMFPNLVYCPFSPDLSLTAYNAASSPKTLSIMLLIAGIGMPLVLAYTAVVYRIFRGKVRLGPSSY